MKLNLLELSKALYYTTWIVHTTGKEVEPYENITFAQQLYWKAKAQHFLRAITYLKKKENN